MKWGGGAWQQGVAVKEAAVRVAVGQRRWSSGVDGGQRGNGRVRESGVEGRIDRETKILFGFARKIPTEKFSCGVWWPAAADRRRQDTESENVSRNNIPKIKFSKWEELAEELMR
nr:hypothetical protein [Tanacetum cinerariifolium]